MLPLANEIWASERNAPTGLDLMAEATERQPHSTGPPLQMLWEWAGYALSAAPMSSKNGASLGGLKNPLP